MERHHVWIASHFHLLHRFKLFEDTLKSIASQTLLPDVIILSYSVQQDLDINQSLKEFFEKWIEPKKIKYVLLQQPERLYQFQHLRCIYDYVLSQNESPDDIVITFCDDDDMLHESRLEQVNVHIKEHSIVSCFFSVIKDEVMFEYKEKNSQLVKRSEFGCFSCRFHHMTKFWTSELITIAENITDIYFMAYFRNAYCIPISLYYKRLLLYTYGSKIWRVPLEKTNSPEFMDLLQHIHTYLCSIPETNLYVRETDGRRYRLRDKEEVKHFFLSEYYQEKDAVVDIQSFLQKKQELISW